MREVYYEPHPVAPERKAELRGQGYQIIDAVFAPEGWKPEQEHPEQEQPKKGGKAKG